MRKRLLACVLFSAAQTCYANFFGQTEELDKVQSNIKSVQDNLHQIQVQKNSISAQVADIEKQYGAIAATLHQLEGQIKKKDKTLDQLRQEMQKHQDELSLQQKEMSAQIKAAYATGKREKLKLLLNQEDSARSSRIIAYYNYLNAARIAKVKAIQNTLAELDNLESQEHQQAELLAQDLQQKKTEQSNLDSVRKQRNELLLQLTNDYTSNEQQLGRLREGESKLKSLMASLQSQEAANTTLDQSEQPANAQEPEENVNGEAGKTEGNFQSTNDFATLKGKLPWPTKGHSIAKFGSNEDSAVSDGVLIDAHEGTEIRAVTSGKVAYSDWLRGYGLLMIINHGNGYMTLYAFNQSLYKKVGETIKAGEVIASVGQSGGRSQSGLYFGIRKNGHPVSPLEWCKN
jgi:septal ring factor EnvC (AmiA/AmiB activator)